jgi:replication-associated recombination protein RarA
MKQGKLVRIANVVEADECISFLLNRPKLEMVGLGLIYGRPGLGKTTFASRVAFTRGYVYIRLEASTTAKTFAKQLLTTLYHKFGLNDCVPQGSTNTLFQTCTSLLESHEDTVIIVDEIDYAFKDDKLLGAIRDIVDETLAVVLLIGMQNAKDRLSQINEYYFDRCNSFYEFQPVSKSDIKIMAEQMLEVEVNDSLVNYIHFNCCGNLRKAMKVMHILEQNALHNPNFNLNELQLKEA